MGAIWGARRPSIRQRKYLRAAHKYNLCKYKHKYKNKYKFKYGASQRSTFLFYSYAISSNIFTGEKVVNHIHQPLCISILICICLCVLSNRWILVLHTYVKVADLHNLQCIAIPEYTKDKIREVFQKIWVKSNS